MVGIPCRITESSWGGSLTIPAAHLQVNPSLSGYESWALVGQTSWALAHRRSAKLAFTRRENG